MNREIPNKNIELIISSLEALFNSNKDDLELQREVLYFFDYHIMKHVSFNHITDYNIIKSKAREMSDRYSRILLILKRTTDNYIKTIENSIKESQYKSDFNYEYPKFVSPEHPKEAIRFYDKIDKLNTGKGFSILKASELINVSRQTFSKWMKEEKFGLKKRRNNRISLQELYNCYLNILLKKLGK